jgi:hypothetical protein
VQKRSKRTASHKALAALMLACWYPGCYRPQMPYSTHCSSHWSLDRKIERKDTEANATNA